MTEQTEATPSNAPEGAPEEDSKITAEQRAEFKRLIDEALVETRKWIKPITIEEVRALAFDIFTDRVFSSLSLTPPTADAEGMANHLRELSMVFMPFALSTAPQRAAIFDAGGRIFYERMSEASPLAANGMPTFFSFKVLHLDNVDALFDELQRLESLRDAPRQPAEAAAAQGQG